MQALITEELIWALHRERVNAAVRAWLASQVSEEPGDYKCPLKGPWRIVPLNLRPARCR